MELTIPLLVSVDKREIYALSVPGFPDIQTFRGPSLARLLDDAALYLMEHVPRMSPQQAARLAFSPYVELRRVKVEVIKGTGRDETRWSGRLPVVIDRWPKERFLIATLPTLESRRLAVAKTGALSAGVSRYLSEWATKTSAAFTRLEEAVCKKHDYLELLNVDVDLPTILPSRPRKLRKKKKPKAVDDAPSQSTPKKREVVPPQTLTQVADSLTHRALDGRLDRAFYRDSMVDDVLKHLEREGAAILLVGPSGVGKTAIVHEVVQRLVDKSTSINDRRDVWQVDGNRIIAGMSIVGAWEHRVTEMVNELNARQDVLFVNDLPALVYTGRSAHSDTNVAEFLEPHLGRGEIRIIGECTPERLAVLQDESPSFFARFRVVQVPDMSEDDTLHVLLHVVRRLDRDEPLRVDPAALETAVALARRFRALDVNPGKAVDLLTRAIADRTEVARDEFGRRRIDAPTIIRHFARQAGLPEFLLFGRGGPTSSQIRSFFQRRIVGQPEAVEAAVDIITTVSQALNDPIRPIATLLFVGPTGVGKTETTKAVAEFLFGSKDRMVRFDMSEFQQPYAVDRLIGNRFRPDGELTRRVQQQPFSLVLLDEIEKAHPSIFDSLLQVLGEGRLTNAAGRTVNFTSTVVVMTSNLGVRDAEKTVGFSEPTVSSLATHYRSAAEKFFRPEFFNRIDRVVAFRPLDRDVIVPLVRRLLFQMLGRQGLKRSSVLVDVDPELVEVLVDQGFDRRYGARSVKRILEQRLAVPLSQHLVESHSADLRLVEVYPRKRDLGMDVLTPALQEPQPVKGATPPNNWKQVEARHAGLRLALDAILERDDFKRYSTEHSRLLAAMNEEALTEAGESRMRAISMVQEQLAEMVQSIDAFEENYLSVEQYVIEQKTEEIPHREYGTRTVAVETVRPQRSVRTPVRDDIVADLEDLELSMARVDHQLRALDQRTDDRLLIRFACEAPGPTYHTLRTWLGAWGQYSDYGLLLARQSSLAARLGFYRPWGAVARAFVSMDGRWTELTHGGPQAPARLWTLNEQPTEFGGAALWLRGHGLRPLIEAELGLWIWQYQFGPDYELDVVRIEEVGDDGDPLERLQHLDASQEALRAARRQGEVDGALMTEAPILRWFDNDKHSCAQTGVRYEADRNQVFLQQVVLRRLHSAMMNRVLTGRDPT